MKATLERVPVYEDEKEFANLKAIIKRKTGFNCDDYKQSHLKRRLAVRLRANNSRSYEEYSITLLNNEEESRKLKDTLTVNVTELFRNPETYEAFGKIVLPELVKRKGEDGTIRIWSAGCSNGEEPYSIAIMLLEFLGYKAKRCDISILGTDIDEDSLRIAKSGIFKIQQLEKLSKDRLKRFFIKNGDSYQVIDDIQDIVHFKYHDMISGPRLFGFDIIFCRNVTIYFDHKQQEKLYMNFYNSLNEGGYFLMGKTETLVGQSGGLFRPVNITERIYRKSEVNHYERNK